MSASPIQVDSSAGDPHRVIGRLVRAVLDSIRRRIDARMQPLDLTAMQWDPVLAVAVGRADTVAALARQCDVNCGAMTRMLDRLEEKDILCRRRSETDRRVVHLELTEKGHAAARQIVPIVRDELGVHLKDFDDRELATLTRLLDRMLANGAATH